jgi:pimeloyl-ACP methyl ester carboxylesterase
VLSWVRGTLVIAMLSANCCGAAQAASATLVSIPTPRGVTQAFILVKPDKPVASVILFAGGPGALGLRSATSMKWGGENFLVRTRNKFAAHNFMVAVIDAPSDQRQGMNAVFRMSATHAQDIGAVAAYLKKQADRPVWLIGTSMGTFSAADGAIAAKDIDGLVLTSTITRANPAWAIANNYPNAVAEMALSKITVPVLILSHRDDACAVSPPANAEKLKALLTAAGKTEVTLLDGGGPFGSAPCEPQAPHGYFGIDAKAVDTIADFVSSNSK